MIGGDAAAGGGAAAGAVAGAAADGAAGAAAAANAVAGDCGAAAVAACVDGDGGSRQCNNCLGSVFSEVSWRHLGAILFARVRCLTLYICTASLLCRSSSTRPTTSRQSTLFA